jgi:hypothetical protein
MCLAVQKSMPGDERLHAYAGRRAENCGFCGTKWLGSVSGQETRKVPRTSHCACQYQVCLAWLTSPLELYRMEVLSRMCRSAALDRSYERVSVCMHPEPRTYRDDPRWYSSSMQGLRPGRWHICISRGLSTSTAKAEYLLREGHVMSGISPPAVFMREIGRRSGGRTCESVSRKSFPPAKLEFSASAAWQWHPVHVEKKYILWSDSLLPRWHGMALGAGFELYFTL